MRKTELDRFRNILLEEKDRVTHAITRHQEAIEKAAEESGGGSGRAHSNHMADQGTDEFQYEATLKTTASEREHLREIEAALERIEDGSYGKCEVTGKPISLVRLRALPTARLSIEAQEELERRGAGHF